MFCSNCGSKIDDGLKFCPECGTPVADTAAAQASGTEENVTDDTEITKAEASAVATAAVISETSSEIPAAATAQESEIAVAEAAAIEAQAEAEVIRDEEVKNISEKAAQAEEEAKRVEEEAKAAIADAQAKADEAKAKAEAAMAEAKEKARLANMARAEAEASSAVKKANRKLSVADAAKQKYAEALEEAKVAYDAARKAVSEAEALGVTGLPALMALPVDDAPSAKKGNAPANKNVVAAAPAAVYQDASNAASAQTGENVRLVKPWGYFFLGLLYAIPVIGWIFLLIHTFGKKYKNRQNYAISIWIKLLICLIICAVLALLYMAFMKSNFVVTLQDMLKAVYDLVKSYFTPV